MFSQNSGLVQIWLRLILQDKYTIDDVPNISNLREVVASLLDSEEDDNE